MNTIFSLRTGLDPLHTPFLGRFWVKNRLFIRILFKLRLLSIFTCPSENSEGRVRIEKMLSFFLHVQGIHSWNNDNFSDIIQQEERTKTGTLFTNGHFENFFSCDRQQDYTSAHELVESSSHTFQFAWNGDKNYFSRRFGKNSTWSCDERKWVIQQHLYYISPKTKILFISRIPG